jgi:phage terminase large subunit-like protein
MSNSDRFLDHEPNTICGMCHHQFIMAQVARDIIATSEKDDVIRKWSEESDRRWRSSKFVQSWNKAVTENKDPHLVFKELGWEP